MMSNEREWECRPPNKGDLFFLAVGTVILVAFGLLAWGVI
jgi:hypothetical protein